MFSPSSEVSLFASAAAALGAASLMDESLAANSALAHQAAPGTAGPLGPRGSASVIASALDAELIAAVINTANLGGTHPDQHHTGSPADPSTSNPRKRKRYATIPVNVAG